MNKFSNGVFIFYFSMIFFLSYKQRFTRTSRTTLVYVLGEEKQELGFLFESLDKTCTRYLIEISAEKNKLIINSADAFQRVIKGKGQNIRSL